MFSFLDGGGIGHVVTLMVMQMCVILWMFSGSELSSSTAILTLDTVMGPYFLISASLVLISLCAAFLLTITEVHRAAFHCSSSSISVGVCWFHVCRSRNWVFFSNFVVKQLLLDGDHISRFASTYQLDLGLDFDWAVYGTGSSYHWFI